MVIHQANTTKANIDIDEQNKQQYIQQYGTMHRHKATGGDMAVDIAAVGVQMVAATTMEAGQKMNICFIYSSDIELFFVLVMIW